MKAENIIEVVMKLTGEVHPVADSSIDDKRFENLKILCDVANQLIKVIDDVSYQYKDSHFGSMQKASTYANKFLTDEIGIVE